MISLSPGDVIEYRETKRKQITIKTGTVKQVTNTFILVVGEKYRDTVLINDLISGQIAISIKERGNLMSIDWNNLWPKAKELLDEGLSDGEVAMKLGIQKRHLQSKKYRERYAKDVNREQEPISEEVNDEDKFSNEYDLPIEREPSEPSEDERVLDRAQTFILARAQINVNKVINDPVALALLKELIRQGVA